MKLKAKQMGSIKALKDTLKKGGGSDSIQWIKNIPAEGITARFLTEPEQWFGFDEYWSDEAKSFIPMAEGEHLPDGARKSFRYLCVVLDTETDRVIPLKLPKTAANALILKYDKYDTMMDRDYELQKHGEGLDTTYEVTPEGPAKRNLAKYELLDLEEVLIAARRKALGEDDVVTASGPFNDDDIDDDDDTDEAEDTATGSADDDDDASEFDEDALFPNGEYRTDYSKAELVIMEKHEGLEELAEWWEVDPTIDDILAAQEEGDEEDEDEEESDEDEDIDEDDDDDSDEDDDSDDEAEAEAEADDDDEEVEYDEDELRAMSIRELRLIANDLGIAHRGKSKDELIDEIIESAEA